MTILGISRRTWRGLSVLFGGVLVHLSFGTLYTFGNLNPYLTSYMRWHGSDPDLQYIDCAWVFATATMGQASTMFMGGILERRLGPRITCLLGGWFMSLGVVLTYFSVQHSFALTVLTYGVMFGVGIGFGYA
ncbi:uncharacterized protein LOC106012469, partial [Aplysia californica]|uniref:Uncharacterized protein LOC106012469 n=1 Tax=Aplysia californica TaxID=6500 RepID=A0ABM1A528_APLCA